MKENDPHLRAIKEAMSGYVTKNKRSLKNEKGSTINGFEKNGDWLNEAPTKNKSSH